MGEAGQSSINEFDPYHKWLGIRPEEHPVNHYRLLGITLFESDPDVIVNAADQRMSHVRSFQAGKHSGTTQQLLNELSAARVCLLNHEKKAGYDETLRYELAMTTIPRDESSRSVVRRKKGLWWQGLLKHQPWRHVFLAGGTAACFLVMAILLLSPRARPAAETMPGNELAEKPDVARAVESPKKVPTPAPPGVAPVVAKTERIDPKPGKASLPDVPSPRREAPSKIGRAGPGNGVKETPGGPLCDAIVRVASSSPSDLEQPPLMEPELASKPPSPVKDTRTALTPPKGNRSEDGAERLKESLDKSRSPAEFRVVAETGLRMADEALAAGNRDFAKRALKLALISARKADDNGLATKITLRWIDIQEGRPK